MTTTKRIILFYGPLGKKNKTILGGSETGNNRTIQILLDNDFTVIPISKPYHIIRSRLGEVLYPFQLSCSLVQFTWKLLFTKGSKIIHVAGYYYNMIYFEYLLLFISKICKAKTIYELRAGGLSQSITTRSRIYSNFLRRTLNIASVILIQGYDDISVIEKITKRPLFHYPNYIKDSLIQENNISDRIHSKKIELVYFGRFSPSKQIDFIVDICACLKQKNSNFHIELIGELDMTYSSFDDRSFLQKVKKKIDENKLEDVISFSSSKNHADLMKILSRKHFFLFPTKEKREGHSNSLTEAMACGVVPLASTYGFNKSIIGIEKLVIETFDASLYAERVLSIWQSGEWASLSEEVYEKVLNNYTESKVSPMLINAYQL